MPCVRVQKAFPTVALMVRRAIGDRLQGGGSLTAITDGACGMFSRFPGREVEGGAVVDSVRRQAYALSA